MNALKLETDRLVLRPYCDNDIPALVRLAGSREVAATTLRIPHPYTEQNAREFLAKCRDEANAQPETRFAIVLRNDGQFCGGTGFRIDLAHQHAELGYWLGVPFWGNGYATEAARAMIQYGFETLGLHRIYASYVSENIASGHVLRKIGMKREGLLRGHICKWEKFHDLECYGILRSDFMAGAMLGTTRTTP